ncbi:BLUF domain-containing protein [Brevundimonas sp. PAMC22021]|uniref:BLUF domain-containing protein n=1 Tax=Brevundimonas sp. PAMC22021 TaxID=2861285 RepID=UPI001C62BB11|nr:BLUF domain-containing protein [Brevundimonas sp. PAMC22021]QYF86869.1 BLUF domain-containing protein [Brevundimonas sp. PAMC22021]
MDLFRIVYVSEAVGAASDGLMPLIDIVGASDRNNRRDRLTGVLLRHERRFLQAIEGTRADLDRLMARLAGDKRHKNIRILSDEPIQQRLFPDWGMARVDPTPEVADFLDRAMDAMNGVEAGERAERLLVNASRSMAVAP